MRLKIIVTLGAALFFTAINCYALHPDTSAAKNKKMAFSLTLLSKATDDPIYKAEVTFVTPPKNKRGKTDPNGTVRKTFKSDSWVALSIVAKGYRSLLTKTFHIKADKTLTLKLIPNEIDPPVPTPTYTSNFTASPTNTPIEYITPDPTRTPNNKITATITPPNFTASPTFTATRAPVCTAVVCALPDRLQCLSGNCPGGCGLVCVKAPTPGPTKTPSPPSGPPEGNGCGGGKTLNWIASYVASNFNGWYSADGTKIINAAGTLGISTSSGAYWSIVGSRQYWFHSAISADGNKMFATNWSTFHGPNVGVQTWNNDAFIYISKNAGTAWTMSNVPKSSPGDNGYTIHMANYDDIVTTADGSKLAVIVQDPAYVDRGNYVFTSSDGGTTWIKRLGPTNTAPSNGQGITYRSLSYSPDGAELSLLAHPYSNSSNDATETYVSKNGGSSWSKQAVVPGIYHAYQSFFSGNGQIRLAQGEEPNGTNTIWSSSNGGLNWTKSRWYTANGTLTTADDLNLLTFSYDGQRIVAIKQGTGNPNPTIFISTDAGVNWVESYTITAPYFSSAIQRAIFSANGDILLYAGNDQHSPTVGALWTGHCS
jgi:hypothetical protein